MASSDLARLPAELLADIIAIAAWDAAEVDKPWLARAARTSRAILHVVKPILYHTVLLTGVNFDAILQCCSTGNFSMTRCLWVSKAPGESKSVMAALASAFAHVEHLSATSGLYNTLHDSCKAFDPPMLTLRSPLARDDWLGLRLACQSLTHLHVALEPYGAMPRVIYALNADAALRFVILESTAPGWNPTRLVGTVLPFFLPCQTIERLVICATTDSAFMTATHEALAEYVAARPSERRIWMLDEPTNGRALSLFSPGATFDPGKWTRGRQLLPPSDSTAKDEH